MIINIQKKFKYDDRKWEDIPVEQLNFGSSDEEVDMNDIYKTLLAFLFVWNRLESSSHLPIFEIRYTTINSYNGHYVTDWEMK